MLDVTINRSLIQTQGVDLTPRNHGCLVRIYPSDGVGGLWDIQSEEAFIGRSPGCDIWLDDTSISRRHAAIQRIDEGFLLIDLQSTNGTQLNDRPVQQQLLMAGDRIRVGTYILKFLSNDDIERQYHETVYKMTTTDGLTNAYSRKYMEEVLQREIRRAQRYERPLCLVMMDIDHFKSINDAHGHLAGDEVLQEFSRRIRDCLDDDDVFARYGGEEFCLILSEFDQTKAHVFTEKLRTVVAARPFPTHCASIDLTASFGLITYPATSPKTTTELLHAADQQLYEAKQSGRNRVCQRRLDDPA